MKEGGEEEKQPKGGAFYWETVIDTEHSGDWRGRYDEEGKWSDALLLLLFFPILFSFGMPYLWAAVFASTTPAVCIQERTEFSPPSGSSFIVVPPRGIVSCIPNI